MLFVSSVEPFVTSNLGYLPCTIDSTPPTIQIPAESWERRDALALPCAPPKSVLFVFILSSNRGDLDQLTETCIQVPPDAQLIAFMQSSRGSP